MRYLLLLTVVCLAVLSADAPETPNDASLDERAQFFAAVADGSLTGDDLREAQIERIKDEIHYVQLQTERYSVDNSTEPYPDKDLRGIGFT